MENINYKLLYNAVCTKTDEPIKLLSFIKSEIPDVETWSDYK